MMPAPFTATLRFETGKTGKPGKPNNGAAFSPPGFDFSGISKPGNRENRTASAHNGKHTVFCAEGFPLLAHHSRRNY
jgi:hypothetical protein